VAVAEPGGDHVLAGFRIALEGGRGGAIGQCEEAADADGVGTGGGKEGLHRGKGSEGGEEGDGGEDGCEWEGVAYGGYVAAQVRVALEVAHGLAKAGLGDGVDGEESAEPGEVDGIGGGGR